MIKTNESPLTAPATKKNFDFIDTIRCISMLGIVFEHSCVFWGLRYPELSGTIIETVYMQILKFATIAFFLISGFLINHKFTEYTPGQYLKNRFKSTIGPWAFWIIVLVLLNLLQRYVIFYLHKHDENLINNIGGFFKEQFYNIVFLSNYWFILNFLICITILLTFRKYLYSYWFGIIWGAISLVYSVNLYYQWFETQHTMAFFGFVVYLWMGVMMNRNYSKIKQWLEKTKYSTLLIINLFFFVIACLETMHLIKLGSTDPFNTLRATNILYSLSMFALLLKIGNISKLQQLLKPRQTTFGIYLIHQILIFRLLPEIFVPRHFDINTMSAIGAAGYSLLRFLIVYTLTFLLVRYISKTKFKWSIGSRT